MIQYRDGEANHYTCLVYLLTGQSFAGYCVIQYRDVDQSNVLARVKKTLDSIRAIR